MEASIEQQPGQAAEGQVTEPAAGAEGNVETPDIGESLNALRQTLESRLPEPANPATAESEEVAVEDLMNLLTAEEAPEDTGAEHGLEPEAAGAQPATEDEAAAQQEALNEWFRERVADEVMPYFEQIELRERSRSLAELAREYPDLRKRETLQAIQSDLKQAADYYGIDAISSDPRFVRMALLARRAEQLAANETPADQARGEGASIETAAGAVGGAEDGDEAIVNRIFGDPRKPRGESPFV